DAAKPWRTSEPEKASVLDISLKPRVRLHQPPYPLVRGNILEFINVPGTVLVCWRLIGPTALRLLRFNALPKLDLKRAPPLDPRLTVIRAHEGFPCHVVIGLRS